MSSQLEEIFERLSWYLESWTTVEIAVRTEYEIGPLLKPARINYISNQKVSYVHNAKGDRYKLTISNLRDGSQSKVEGFASGPRTASVVYAADAPGQQSWVQIGRDFLGEAASAKSEWPAPFGILFFNNKALTQYIEDGEARGPTRSDTPGLSTLHVERSVAGGGVGRQIWYFVEARGFPVRVDYLLNAELQWTWSASRFDRRAQLELPIESTYTEYGSSPDGSGRGVLVKLTHVLESFEVDRAHPDHRFWPSIQPGVIVNDTIAKRVYFHGGQPRSPLPVKGKDGPTTPTNPVPGLQVEPNDASGGTGGLAVGLGVTLIIVALVLAVRRRMGGI